jgi:hypothetical protein
MAVEVNGLYSCKSSRIDKKNSSNWTIFYLLILYIYLLRNKYLYCS